MLLRKKEKSVYEYADRAFKLLDAASKLAVEQDVRALLAKKQTDEDAPFLEQFHFALEMRPFRSLFYCRCRNSSSREAASCADMSEWSLPSSPGVEIYCSDLGGGTVILHNTCIINAEHIGSGCRFGAFSVLGSRHNGIPSLGNNVHVCANATVIGDISIGDNAVIGAGAVVLSDVPAGATVVGNPARIVNIRPEN